LESAPVLEHQKARWWAEHNTISQRACSEEGLGASSCVIDRDRDREKKESNKIAEKMKYSEHSPVLGCRGYWIEAARGCSRPLAALRPLFSATAAYGIKVKCAGKPSGKNITANN
jgi:hypothetical protein